jgi:hypothetical protein
MNLNNIKLNELVKICKDKGIKYSGKKKSELIEILDKINNIDNNNDYSVFKMSDQQINLNEQQIKIVKANIKENMRVIACAGSGKTTTIICRLKYLIDSDIDPRKIIVTTFNVDAVKSIKNKITDLFGYMPNITIGTIDSISKKFYYKYKIEEESSFLGVSEYSNKLLEYLETEDGKVILQNYEYIFFDEFQDINNIQFQIILNFYKNGSKVILIGDDAQNIYSFRGSNIEYILNLHKYIDNFVTYKLLFNYRSTPEIINFANNSIKNNKDQIAKKMFPINTVCNTKPIIKHYYNLESQNQEIIRHIISLRYDKNISFDNIAILSRNNYPLKILEEDFEKFNLSSHKKINYVALITNNNDKKPNLLPDHVTLTSIHKAKGLEWKVVFLIGCEDKYFPSEIDNFSLQEERRLFYVAITRPKNILYITFTSNNITRFIEEINPKLYNFINFETKFFDYTQFRNSKYYNSVTELIENLNEEDFQNLRKKNLLPNIEINKNIVHQTHNYNNKIDTYFLHSDYGNFIDRFITRSIGEKNKKSQGLKDHIANTVIGAVVLERLEFFMYQKYKNNFLCNIDKIDSSINPNLYIKILSDSNDKNYIEQISYKDKLFIIKIIEKILECSVKNKFQMSEVIVVPKDYLPKGFKSEMLKSLQNYRNKENISTNILKDVYRVALCGNIYDQRRRLLYKDVSDCFIDNSIILKDIQEKYVQELCNNKLLCKYNISNYEYDIHGEIDLIDITERKIVDFKCSNSKEVKLEWILQLLTYVSLLKINKKKVVIDFIEIYNPLQGNIYKINISEWDKELDFIKYIYKSRDKKLSKNKKPVKYLYIN